jgi:hypothetical protein
MQALIMLLHFLQMSSSETESDSENDNESESESESDTLQILKEHVQFQALLFSSMSVIYEYYMTYCDKNPPRTSVLSGYAWVLETLKTPGESHRMFKMNERLFIQLHDLLITQYGLNSSIHMSSLKSLTII